jgi:ferredoxin
MPAQVVVVRRSRRSLFAAPRALPDWLRSVWAAFRLTPPSAPDSDPGAQSVSSIPMPSLPRLVHDSGGDHACVGCRACERICPSRCLSLATEGAEDAIRVVRFELAGGACIGCDLCVDSCPEDALEMVVGVRVDLALSSGRPVLSDLLHFAPEVPE